jgi:hypothetical protein
VSWSVGGGGRGASAARSDAQQQRQLGDRIEQVQATVQKVLNASKSNRSIVLNSVRIDIAGKSDATRAVTVVEKYRKTISQRAR